MQDLIEPNIHPVLVHFVIGLLATGSLALVISAFTPGDRAWRESLRTGGDWMLGTGIGFAVLAIIAGFVAAFTVDHDTPSHLTMNTHRNWALTTAAVFVALGVWRWRERGTMPSRLFAVLLLVATGLLFTTAWYGGRLVFHHGIGVESLPETSAAGHEHGEGTDHSHDDGTGGGAAAGIAGPTPEAAADAFHAALAEGDVATVRALLAPDVLILESGGAERSLAEYESHHMEADMNFMSAMDKHNLTRRVERMGDTAFVSTESAITGTYNDQDIAIKSQETLVMRQHGGSWQIMHVHWSSSPLSEEDRAAIESGDMIMEEEETETAGDGHDHEH